ISETDPQSSPRHHGDTTQRARLPGEIPPIKVTSAATASAADTAAGKRDGAGSWGPLMYMRTATRMYKNADTTLQATPTTASATWPARTALRITTNLAANPAVGGIPVRDIRNSNMSSAIPGRCAARP